MVPTLARWHKVGNSYQQNHEWKLSVCAVAGALTFIVGILCAAGRVVGFLLAHNSGRPISFIRAGLLFFNILLAASAAAGYVFVSSKAARSSQLHTQGLALLMALMSWFLYLVSEAFCLKGMCAGTAAALAASDVCWGIYKVAFFLLVQQKMEALGPPISHCVQARSWGRALVVSVMATPAACALILSGEVVLTLRGITCDELLELSALGMALGLVTALGMASLVVAGLGMVGSAWRLMRRASLKLAERQVLTEELSKVEAKLRLHLVGVIISITSAQLSQLGTLFCYLGLVGDDMEESYFVGEALGTIDLAGDIIGIMLLSGIAVLLVREDPTAGDVGCHIRGLLHSAVLTSRARVAFEGRLDSRSKFCVASFPGKYLADWHALTWACEQGEVSSACVFLPTADSEHRFGKHVESPGTPGKCWCSSLYGQVKPWGCLWFQCWRDNIERAVDLGLPLVVVFFPGEAGKDVIRWDELGKGGDLWDGVGLGGSQKVEVAYLKMRGFHIVEEDVEAMRRRVYPGSALQTALLPFTDGA